MNKWRFVWVLLLIIPAPLLAQQRDCCWCSSPRGPFGVEVPAGFGSFQCRIACQSNYGSAVGFKHGACYATPSAAANKCRLDTAGGDCRGNNWCQCEKMVVNLNKRDLVVGEDVTAQVATGDLGSGKPLVGLPGDNGVLIEWGDGTKTNAKLANGSYTHKYSKPGSYTVHANEFGQFKWNANDGSCSYVCRAEAQGGYVDVTKNLTASQIERLLQADKSPQAKKDLAKQQKMLQTLKSQ